jgi:putative phage-type endonuclease
MRIFPGSQNSDRWLAAKRGRISASRIADAVAVLKKGGESAARRNYRFELAAERASAIATSHYVTPEMERGLELEETARSYYSTATETLVDQVGFVLHPLQDFSGASPDGLVGDDGLLEIKCPKTETLFAWLDSGKVPDEYILQMQWQMACTERQWCDFYGFDDRVPGVHFLQRVPRSDELIASLEYASVELNGEVEALLQKLGLPPTQWTDVNMCQDSAQLEEPAAVDEPMITDEDVEWLQNR